MTRLDWDRAKRRKKGKADRKPSDAQLRLLADLGVTRPPATMAEASKVIDRELKRRKKR
jgi:hypothetical protein